MRLPRIDRQRILAQYEQVEWAISDVLGQHAERVRYVYFAINGFLSLITPIDGADYEIGMVGSEGMQGISLMLGRVADDRRCAHGNELRLTHAFLANMLGMRRAGITMAAGVLHKKKLINYARGKITVTDRAGLEQASCACYRLDLQTNNEMLGA